MKKSIIIPVVILLFIKTYSNNLENTITTSSSGENFNSHHTQQNPEDEKIEAMIVQPSNKVIPVAKLEGFFIEKNPQGASGHLQLKLVFSEESEFGSAILAEKDPDLELWTVDFYNADMGGIITEKIDIFPVFNSVFEEYSVDLNEGVSGMQPDLRQVLRLKLATDQPVQCNIKRDKFNKVVIDLLWVTNDDFEDYSENSTWLSKLSFWK